MPSFRAVGLDVTTFDAHAVRSSDRVNKKILAIDFSMICLRSIIKVY
jgi:hypothetical protein